MSRGSKLIGTTRTLHVDEGDTCKVLTREPKGQEIYEPFTLTWG